MPGYRRKLLPLCIAASLLSGASLEAAAIGVGEIHLQSFLGAPLQAEVPLNHLGELSADQLKVQVGSQNDYSALGVEYTYLHSQLKIEPFVKNGQGYVRISTREPVSEPYLNFVLSLRWPQGQLVREFTVLLDPPAQSAVAVAAAQPASAEAVAQPQEIAADVVAKHAPRHRAHKSLPTAVQAEPKRAVAADRNYMIQRGDSLWRIASRIRPAQVPVEQVMAAIQARNPEAFINGNPDLLKEAVIIALPDAEQIAAVATGSPVAAKQTAHAAEQPVSSDAGVAQSAPVVAQLAEENSALKAQVTDLTGNVATLNQSLADSEQRMHQLEVQLNELIKQMQQQRATMAALSGAGESASAPIAQNTGSVINQVNAAELNGAAKSHTPWWVHLLYWLGIGGAVTWAVREHFWPQRRLAAAMAGGADAIVKFAPAEPMARPAAKAPASINTVRDAAELTLDIDDLPAAASSLSNDGAAPAPELLNSGEEPVDISISAGVFVAFGRYEEAERLLREAIARDPARTDLKLQLLDVLMQSDQPGAFDDLAEAIEREATSAETLAELAVLRDSYRARH